MHTGDAGKSGLHLFSLGVVVETKKDGSSQIKVSPIEKLNKQPDGYIIEQRKEFESSKKGTRSVNFKTEHENKQYLLAEWVAFSNTNRVSPPDVVMGETVHIYKFGDVDEYFWSTFLIEPLLRRKETVTYAYSNLEGGIGEVGFNPNTSYWMEVSTKKKKIQIHTAKNDGEYCSYDITINTKAGNISIKDDVGQLIELNSKSGSITLKAKSEVNVEAPNINLKGNVNNKGNNSTSGSISAGEKVSSVKGFDGPTIKVKEVNSQVVNSPQVNASKCTGH